MTEWVYESDSEETFCWAEMARTDIVIVRTDERRWRWRVEMPMKGRRPQGECATLHQAKKNALAAYAYVNEAQLRNAAIRERAAVMAYLRTRGGIASDLAEDIERGEHRREEKP